MTRAFVLVIVSLNLGCGGGGPSVNDPGTICRPLAGTVTRILDGDTVELESGEKVRYLLVDTPELSDKACFAEEAKAFNASMVLGEKVTLQYDADQCVDIFGSRLLPYVFVGDVMLNRVLVERGFAKVLVVPVAGRDQPYVHEVEFGQLEAGARDNRAGLWGACDP